MISHAVLWNSVYQDLSSSVNHADPQITYLYHFNTYVFSSTWDPLHKIILFRLGLYFCLKIIIIDIIIIW